MSCIQHANDKSYKTQPQLYTSKTLTFSLAFFLSLSFATFFTTQNTFGFITDVLVKLAHISEMGNK